jgi:hypothetical protein
MKGRKSGGAVTRRLAFLISRIASSSLDGIPRPGAKNLDNRYLGRNLAPPSKYLV